MARLKILVTIWSTPTQQNITTVPFAWVALSEWEAKSQENPQPRAVDKRAEYIGRSSRARNENESIGNTLLSAGQKNEESFVWHYRRCLIQKI